MFGRCVRAAVSGLVNALPCIGSARSANAPQAMVVANVARDITDTNPESFKEQPNSGRTLRVLDMGDYQLTLAVGPSSAVGP